MDPRLSDPAHIDPILQPEDYLTLLHARERLASLVRTAQRAGIPVWKTRGKASPPKPLDIGQLLLGLRPDDLASASQIPVGRLRSILAGKAAPSFLEGVRLARTLDRDPLQLALFLEARRAARPRRKWSPEARSAMSQVMSGVHGGVAVTEIRGVLDRLAATLTRSPQAGRGDGALLDPVPPGQSRTEGKTEGSQDKAGPAPEFS